MTSPFQEWPKIPRYSKAHMTITEKIDGTNAHIHILPITEQETLAQIPEAYVVDDLAIAAASRSRYLSRTSDNFGFAKWVEENKAELVKLGVGRHYGEWWGPGIQRGYGLKEKRFSLFNVWRWKPDELPTSVVSVVPVLYQGRVDHSAVDAAMSMLAIHGSTASPGFMRPEGVIVQIGQQTYKDTFDAPEGKWREAA